MKGLNSGKPLFTGCLPMVGGVAYTPLGSGV